MPKTEVTNALVEYLKPENSNITYLGAVYPALPRVPNEADLFNFVPPGLGVGVLMFLFIENQSERRIAFGGPHQGRKFRTYGLSLLCIMKSDLPSSAEGQAAFNEFIDSTTGFIQADRNAGTEATSLGGSGPYAGTGVVFQWGEGGLNGSSPDITIDYPVPKTAAGGIMLFQAVIRVTVCETLNT